MLTDALDTPILRLSRQDVYTLRSATTGLCIMSQTGGGKTSAAATIANGYLRSGMGALVLVAKESEIALWQSYCAKAGRSESLIVLDGKTPIINFLSYELARQGAQGLNSVVELLMRVLEMARLASPSPGRQGEAFWEDVIRQILRNIIPLLYAAKGTVRISELLAAVRSTPNSSEQLRDPEWQRRSEFYALLRAAADKLDNATGERLMGYWAGDFVGLDPKTRGNIIISLTTALDRFNHGWLHEAFCTETLVPPELTFHGAIILMAMPALTLYEDAIIAQMLYKYLLQRAILARDSLDIRQRQRAVCIWMDEGQNFVTSFDADYQAQCRSSLGCTVFLTQSLPTLYAKLASDGGRDRVLHLLSNYGVKLWLTNSCSETNTWASSTIGKSLQTRANFSESQGSNTSYGMNMGEGSSWNREASDSNAMGHVGGFGWSLDPRWGRHGSEGGSDNWGRNRGHGSNHSVTHGHSQVTEDIISAGEFGRILKTGGPANNYRVTGIWYQAGHRFKDSGGNSLLVEFIQ